MCRLAGRLLRSDGAASDSGARRSTLEAKGKAALALNAIAELAVVNSACDAEQSDKCGPAC